MVEQVAQAMEEADFPRARVVNGKLKAADSAETQQLYGLLTDLRLDVYEEQKRDVRGDMRDLELLRAQLADMPQWPLHWYIQAWFTAPFVSGRHVDPHYLFHLCQSLANVEEREECLLRAAYYAVEYAEHHFIALLKSLEPFDEEWLADPFHRTMYDALMAVNDRDGERLAQEIDNLRNVANTPLRKHEVELFIRRYGRITEEAEA